MRRYKLSKEARQDLRQIKEYIAEDSIDAALRMVTEFREAFRLLAQSPGIGHRRPDLTPRTLLFWPVRAYLVIYSPGNRPLEIVAILHGRRNVVSVLAERFE